MSLEAILEDRYIKVRDIQKISLTPDEVLLIKVGIDGMKQEDVNATLSMIARTFRENLPHTKMIITTVTTERPFDVYGINQAFVIEEKYDGSDKDSGIDAERNQQP